MAIAEMPRTEAADGADAGDAGPASGAFLRWGLLTYLAMVATVVVAIVVWLGGHLAYVLDDAAIHLSLADNLAHDGTWGVVPGHFESASSSPLWTVLVAGALLVAGPAAEWVPLVLNVAAGAAAVAVLARAQTAVAPGRRRPAEAAATTVLVVLVLFLPGLAVVGMEHSLHVALVLAAVAGVHRWALDRPGPRPALTYLAVVLATLTRFETAFLAVGLVAALLAVDRRAHLRRAAGVLVAAGVPIALFGVVNRALGGGWLPNSILAKGQATGRPQDDGLGPFAIVERLTEDPMVTLLFGLALLYVVTGGLRGRSAVPAVALVVTTPMHAVLADVGWYERYQAYLIAVGVYLVLSLLTEVPAGLRRQAIASVCVLGVLFSAAKADLLTQAPFAADDMYRHQYQAGRFLDRYYDGEPVATDQLGYISYLHDGPLTDFAGLGDHEVLTSATDRPSKQLWARLAAERGFRVVVLYDKTAAFNVPRGWVRVGEWRIDGEPVTGVSRTLQFYATVPEEVAPLQDHLRDFEDDLPHRIELRLNDNAGLQAMALGIARDEAAEGPQDSG